jgi:WD40 repeat protein
MQAVHKKGRTGSFSFADAGALPVETWRSILLYSSCGDRGQIVQVCKLFNNLLKEDKLWSAIWTLPFDPLLKEFESEPTSYRAAFQTLAAYKGGKVVPPNPKKSRLNHGNEISTDASCMLRGGKMVTVCDDGSLALWCRADGDDKLHRRAVSDAESQHSDEVYRLINVQGPDGEEFVFSCSKDGSVKKWHPESGRLLQTFSDAERVRALYTLWYAKPDGGTIFASVLLWNAPEGEEAGTLVITHHTLHHTLHHTPYTIHHTPYTYAKCSHGPMLPACTPPQYRGRT